MLNKLIDLGVANRLLVLLALLAILVGAVMLIPRLNLDAFPDVTNVQVTINTEAQGLAAEEVEQLITYPIEAVMYSLPDVEEVRSIPHGCLYYMFCLGGGDCSVRLALRRQIRRSLGYECILVAVAE